jgi:hypothetical protein
MQPKGSALFKKLGYAPLKDYLTNETDQEREDAQAVLGAYAREVAEAMMNSAQTEPSLEPASTLWMVGHAIYLPAAALGIASLVGCEDPEVILSTNTQEAEGSVVDLSKRHGQVSFPRKLMVSFQQYRRTPRTRQESFLKASMCSALGES